MLVDTSVWIDHLRRGHAVLSALLEAGRVMVHPFVVGELACGRLERRKEILTLLKALPQAEVAHHDEVMAFVETHRLMGSGVGWVDVHLLASAKLGDVSIWTADARLKKAAIRLGLYPEPAPAEK